MLRSRARSSTASSCSSAATAWPKALGSASTRAEARLPRWGALDQGFWPDGVYSAPSDAALRDDLLLQKALGFNAQRHHVKVESRRFYYHADKIGLLIWQDMPAPECSPNDNATYAQVQDIYASELSRLVVARRHHPSIIQ